MRLTLTLRASINLKDLSDATLEEDTGREDAKKKDKMLKHHLVNGDAPSEEVAKQDLAIKVKNLEDATEEAQESGLT